MGLVELLLVGRFLFFTRWRAEIDFYNFRPPPCATILKPMLKLSQVNRSEWENFVDTLEYVTPLMSYTWAEFEKSLSSSFEALKVIDGNRIVALLPLKTINARRGRFVYLRHAPILDWAKVTPDVLSELFKLLKTYAGEHKAFAVRFQAYYPENHKLEDMFKKLGALKGTNHEVDAERSVRVDLYLPLERIFRTFRKTTRWSIKKAQELGIRVVERADWKLFYDIFSITLRRHRNWKAQAVRLIRKQFEFLSKKKMSRMFFAYYKDKPIAAGIFTYYKNMVMYHHSGSIPVKLPSMYAIIWHVIKDAKKRGYKVLDLWGVAPKDAKNHPWYNLSIFKRGFGGREVKMMHAYDLVINPLWHLTRLYEKFESRKWR